MGNPSKGIFNKMFMDQKRNAKYRNIPFLLTFDNWINIWKESGHLNERGRAIGKYCMSRFGDKGPYSVDNVEIVLHEYNSGQSSLGKPNKNSAKVTADFVKYIRSIYKPGSVEFGGRALARKYNMKQSTISSILTRRSWGDI